MNQESYVGFGSIQFLKDVLLRYSVRSIFLVTGKSSFDSSGARETLQSLLRSYDVHHFFEFSENPKLEDVQKGIQFFRTRDVDLVLAVGGGSVIDMAKLINVFACEEDDIPRFVFEHKEPRRNSKPLVAIPTTAGAGSEATHFAVLYIDKKKYSVAHSSILPRVAIVDPTFTRTLPPVFTATSGIDALCQAIESYWSILSTDESKIYAREAIGLIIQHLSRAVHNPSDDARLAMARAAHLAGKAINITKTTAPHALSYALTSWFGVPHGQAVGLTLPHFLVFNYQVSQDDLLDRRGVKYVKTTLEEINECLGCSGIDESKARIHELMKQIGLATTFAELQVDKKKAIAKVVEEVNVERLINNPRRVTQLKLQEILEAL